MKANNTLEDRILYRFYAIVESERQEQEIALDGIDDYIFYTNCDYDSARRSDVVLAFEHLLLSQDLNRLYKFQETIRNVLAEEALYLTDEEVRKQMPNVGLFLTAEEARISKLNSKYPYDTYKRWKPRLL